jgi:uncharacterized membrane protein YfcA
MAITNELLLALFAAAVLAGFVDTIAGGGGLITIPTLLLTNMAPVSALATNKVQAVSGSTTAAIAMIRRSLISPRESLPMFVAALLGSAIGTIVIQYVPSVALDAVIPIVLLCIACYFIFAPQAGKVATQARIGIPFYQSIVVPLIGMYDGMFGPGTGSFFCMSAIGLRGMRILEATAAAKLLNCATNAASAVIFICGGHVVWPIAITMMFGQIIGASGGAYCVTSGGTKFIKPLIITICVVMIARYVLQKHLFGLHVSLRGILQ